MSSLDPDEAADTTRSLRRRLAESLEAGDVDRRSMLKGLSGAAGASALFGLTGDWDAQAGEATTHSGPDADHDHGHFGQVGEYRTDDFDPHEFLRTFNTGDSGQDDLNQEVYEEDGRTVRHFTIPATDETIEVAPGVEFPAWTYNGQVPGPTLRAVEGDLIRVTFDNDGRHGHTIHPHLRNPRPEMDGIPTNGPGVIDATDGRFTYEWPAEPAGVHFYHCHSMPLKAHLHRGLYGVFVVDPDPERVRENPRDYTSRPGPVRSETRDEMVEIAKARNHTHPESDAVDEMVVVMNGFDTNFDGENEIYAANSRAFAYGVETNGKGDWRAGESIRPIQIDRDETQRVYLVNATEFDPINSFHTHSQFFDYYDHGTALYPTKQTVDTVMQCQAQRGIIELDYSDHEPGLYMFHAHQSEFAELGWMSFFEVQ